jgi:hypothetical protein
MIDEPDDDDSDDDDDDDDDQMDRSKWCVRNNNTQKLRQRQYCVLFV